jgi:Flp pilus assembly pilin Flp
MRSLLQRFNRENTCATAIEYALLAVFICIAAIGGVNAVGSKTSGMYNNITSNVSGVM